MRLLLLLLVWVLCLDFSNVVGATTTAVSEETNSDEVRGNDSGAGDKDQYQTQIEAQGLNVEEIKAEISRY